MLEAFAWTRYTNPRILYLLCFGTLIFDLICCKFPSASFVLLLPLVFSVAFAGLLHFGAITICFYRLVRLRHEFSRVTDNFCHECEPLAVTHIV